MPQAESMASLAAHFILKYFAIADTEARAGSIYRPRSAFGFNGLISAYIL